MSMSANEFGIKTQYVFREASIPTSHRRSDIYRLLKSSVGPAVRELEHRALIDSFHHFVGDTLHVRLSSFDWKQSEGEIRHILRRHRIPQELRAWDLAPASLYGSAEARLLCYHTLEANSRLMLAFVELRHNSSAEHTPNLRRKLMHQWIHFLFNQGGYLHAAQLTFEFNDAFDGLYQLIREHSGDAQVVSFLKGALQKVRRELTRLEQSMTNA